MKPRAGIALLALGVAGAVAAPRSSIAQDTGRVQVPVGRAARGGGRQGLSRPFAGEGRQGRAGDLTDRQLAVREIRQRMDQRIRNQLQLNPQQFRSLKQTEQKYNRQRTDVNLAERQTRQSLIAAMNDTGPRDQAKIAQYIDALTQSQRKKADLVEAEQKELSIFLTPMQRAQLLGLRENLQKLLQQLNQRMPAAPPSAAGAKRDTTPLGR